jgi:hypothetical protein
MFFVFLACTESLSFLEEKEPVIVLTPLEQYEEMEKEIQDAMDIWEEDQQLSGDDSDYADKKLILKNSKQDLIRLYQENFSSLQPLLYKNDPVGCVELELQFGALFQVYGSHRSRDREQQGKKLLSKLKEEITSLPVPDVVLEPKVQKQEVTTKD